MLGVVEDGVVVASAMVGHDGHRGWVYYLAVELAYQRSGFGAAVMSEAEEWVRRAGTTKIQLMVRSDNADAEDFYRRRGYLAGDVTVFARDLE